MRLLKITSCQAEIAESLCDGIAGYLGERLGIPVEFISDIPWQERERLLDAGEIHAGWICGLPYVWRADRPACPIELLAAPVMSGERYAGRPVYFSDVVVHASSRFRSFSDLRGAAWAYNEPASHSGYNIVRYHLASLGEASGFFGRVIETGAHQNTLSMILSGEIDGSAIDSTVLDLALDRDPSIGARLRTVATFGPSPVPPWVILRSVPPGIRSKFREVLATMHEDPAGVRILARGRVSRFAGVTNRDYNPIREMDRVAGGLAL